MRVALLTYNARAGDAIGAQVAAKLAYFQERAADVRVFLEVDRPLHPALRRHAQAVDAREPHGEWWGFLTTADLVVAEYGQYYSLLNLLPLLTGGKPRILFDYHGVTPPELWGAHNREALAKGVEQRGLVWCADGALAHSSITFQELRGQCGFPAERVHRLGYPIDLERFARGAVPNPLRQRLGLEGASVLLFVGRLAPNKRVPLLVEALGRLRDLSPPVHALVVGDASDLYQAQAERCRERAAALGVADRLHLLGRLPDEELADAYRAADVLVMPSRWEGFCIPVIEAMACGVPVVAARAAALPETVGDAGLTFTPDNASDLARQVRRVLDTKACPVAGPSAAPPSGCLRVAIVTGRYGEGFAGGAERSMQTIAETLHGAGHSVEIFATCFPHADGRGNELRPGTTDAGGIRVHRFAVDRDTHPGASDGPADEGSLSALPRSTALVSALRERLDQLDVIIAGPYLSGLTLAVARAFPERTVLLPCFHDEPLAHLPARREAYERVAGILYHTPEEQELAQATLGLNHPYAAIIGTCLDEPRAGGAQRAGAVRDRYVVYCGRYMAEKGVCALLAHARRYAARHPGRFTFVFAGEGPVPIPRESWACDLGFLPEPQKRALLAGADALVQLSRNESLSLVALEAWAEGTPVIADAGCAVLAGQLRRSDGGCTVDGYEAFARTLNHLWHNPEHWRALGQRGRAYVCAAYGSRGDFLARVEEALAALRRPVHEQMRARGLDRARRFAASAWRESFGKVVEAVLDGPARPYHARVEVRRRSATRSVRVGTAATLLAARVINWGTHPVAAEGPGRWLLYSRVLDEQGREPTPPSEGVPLPGLLLPGRSRAAAIPVPVPETPGTYRVELWAEEACEANLRESSVRQPMSAPFTTSCRLIVAAEVGGVDATCCATQLDTLASDLTEADRLQRLPEDYVDVTEGLLASLKRRIKSKLLGNFKRAYVDVLSRQQSAFNRQVLAALQELTECLATLDDAVRRLHEGHTKMKRPRATQRQRKP
jgi:glycosyltransferase involved in cell wall biosynthesis